MFQFLMNNTVLRDVFTAATMMGTFSFSYCRSHFTNQKADAGFIITNYRYQILISAEARNKLNSYKMDRETFISPLVLIGILCLTSLAQLMDRIPTKNRARIKNSCNVRTHTL